MLFLIIAYNEGTIIEIFDVFCKFHTQISLTNEIVEKKIIMLKKNLLINQNAH